MATELLINVDVSNLQAAITFYREALGLRLGRRLFNNSVAEMLGAPVPIYLLEKSTGSTIGANLSRQRDYQRHWTPVHLDFPVADIDEAVVKAQAAGAQLEGKIQTYAWGRQATMADPFGHGFCLIEFLGRGYDEVTE